MEQAASSSEWTREKVIRELKRKREELGKSPSMRDVNSSLVHAAEKLFGSWNDAKEEAGLKTFEYKKGKSWSKEKVIGELKKLADELGKAPAATDNQNLAHAASRYFGSWNDAKQAAGLKVFSPPEGQSWSKERVIQGLKNLAERVGRVPKKYDDQNLKNAACRQFESWNQALKAAGVDTMEPREDSIPIVLDRWESRRETLKDTVEEVKDVLPSGSVSDIEGDAINLLRSIRFAKGYSLRGLALGCIYLSCRSSGIVVFPEKLADEVLDEEDGKAVEKAAKTIRRETEVPSPEPFKIEKVVEKFARSAGFGDKALEDAVELAEKSADKLILSGRSRKSLAAAILYIVSYLHPSCDRLTQDEVGNVCNVTGVSVRNALDFLCERLERDDLPFTPHPSGERCSGAIAEAFLTPEETADMIRIGKETKWSKEKIIRNLQDLADELGRTPIAGDNPALATAAREYFSSWNQAKREAGLEVLKGGRKPEWSRERVVDSLRNLASKLGRTPKAIDNQALYSAARKYFGSWNSAKKEAGLEPPEKGEGREWVKDKIIQELQNLADRMGRSPRIKDDQRLASAAISYFGSWGKAKDEAGLKTSAPPESAKGN